MQAEGTHERCGDCRVVDDVIIYLIACKATDNSLLQVIE
jgi:hypothetical protein